MKKLNVPALLFTLITVLPQLSTAQKTEPIFEIPAGNMLTNTKFLVQAGSGELITGNDMKMVAIDPDKKTIIWENKDFLGLSEDEIAIIDGTPFIKIERQKVTSLAKNKNTYIIRANDGKIVYDSRDEGIKVRNTLMLPKMGGMLLEVVKDGFLSVSFIDFATAKESWTVPLVKEKTGGIGIGALKRAVKSHIKSNSAFGISPIVDVDQNLLLVNKSEIFCIAKAGNLVWKKEFDENVDDAYLSTDGKSLFIGYKKYIDKLTTATGNSSLKEPIKMRDALNGISPMGSDYLVYNEAGLNIMDANGNMKWAKDAKLGNITQVKYTAAGILAIEADEDDETVFYWVDNTGKKIWDQKVDGGIILAEPTDKGVMYVTSERANVLTFEKGKDVWNKDIKIKGVPAFGIDKANRILYAFAKEKVHSFNFTDVSYKLVAEGLDLKKFDDEKERALLDIRKNGTELVISTNQNVAAVQISDGKILYNNYFKDIGSTRKKWGKALGVAAGLAGAAMDVSALSKGDFTISQTTDQYGNPVANSYTVNPNNPAGQAISGAGSELFTAANQRYLASQATKDNLYILSEMPEGNGMLVWNKEKGEISKKITFSDITPQYTVDELKERVYIIVGNTIKAYDLK